MKRRQALKVMGAAGATASVAGCSGILGGGCGPGEDEIGELAEIVNRTGTPPEEAESTSTGTSELPSVEGKIQSIGDNEIIIDDGTGTAKLTTLDGSGFQTTNVGEGDCAQATGFPLPPEDDADYDIRFIVDEIGLADE